MKDYRDPTMTPDELLLIFLAKAQEYAILMYMVYDDECGEDAMWYDTHYAPEVKDTYTAMSYIAPKIRDLMADVLNKNPDSTYWRYIAKVMARCLACSESET